MRKPLYELKSMMPFISGGLFAGALPYIMRLLGNDIILNIGNGIHQHRDGTLAGALACKQAIEIAMQGKDIKDEYKKYAELKTAVEQFGIYEYGDTFANEYFVSIFIKS
jgi:ribulose 1,5-bisphosphate carboxylase large subunit-like protein